MKERGPETTRLDVTALLEHRDWLQRLARHLVSPTGAAEDALQDTWLLALRHPQRDGARARPWLARVLTNAFRRRLRGERRRRRREQAVASWRGLVDQPAASGLEQMQLQRRLIELVDTLEEPYRSVVVMRYCEDRSAASIAKALEVPEGTVRWRTHEALSRLRRALDDQTGGSRVAWLAPMGELAASRTRLMGGPLVWLTGTALVLVLVGAAVVLRAPGVSNQHGVQLGVGMEHTSRTSSKSSSSDSSEQATVATTRPIIAAAALALAGRRMPPLESLAQARAWWTRACPEPQIDGLCTTVIEATGRICPQAAAAGPRLAALSRRQGELERALALWNGVSDDRALPYQLRIQADLALAEDKLEALLAIEPLRDVALMPHTQARSEEAHERFRDFQSRVGKRMKEAAWAFERLSGASDEFPEVQMARARLGQTFAEAARLKMAMHIPDGLPKMTRWGKDEQAAFCRSIAQNASRLFENARRQFRHCADVARTANPPAAVLCGREPARLPPEPPPS